MASALPAPFGRYTLVKRIATGGMAEIFLAKQTGPGRFERSLVIKRILPHLAEDPKFTAMFLDEAALAAHLSHPHIAAVHDFGQEDGAYYIAMELVRGPDLKRIINACRDLKRPIPVPVAVRIVSQVLAALDYAHRATNERGEPMHVVHRDVSPQNVLISNEGAVKLVDFGIAKAADTSHQTEAGVVKGKFAYLAPEQLGHEKLDARCDLFAAGLVLWELLTLERAFPGDGPTVLRAVMEARVPPVLELRPDVPKELVEALGWALQRDREKRPRDCRTLQHELDEMLVGWGKTVAQDELADFVRGLEVEWGKPLSALGTGSLSGPKMIALLDATPAPPLAFQPRRKLVTEKVRALDDPEEDDEITSGPIELVEKRGESGRHPVIAPMESIIPLERGRKLSMEGARLARPVEPVPGIARRTSLPPMAAASLPHMATPVPAEGPGGRSALMPQPKAEAGRSGMVIGLLAALALAALGFFGVRYVFGAHAPPPPHASP